MTRAALARWVGAIVCAAATGLLSTPTWGQAVQVMVLGTYHFANPGLDLFNAQVDDVLSRQRQQEVAAVVDALAGFRPTVVAVEARADELPGRALPGYRRLLDEGGELRRNEIEQIGFRLARQLRLPQVVGVDAPGSFPFEAVRAYAARAGRAAELQQALDVLAARTRDFEALTRQLSVGALLRHLNQPEAIRLDHGWIMQTLSYGGGAEQPGAELVGRWMARNAAICARLLQVVRPGDRVLLLIGAGHSPLLRQCVQDMPGWQRVEPGPYLP